MWGVRNGIRIGLAPTKGPRGLVRVYAPYLGQEFPTMVNFLSLEPRTPGQRGRDQSELQTSREDPGEQGLRFDASNSMRRSREAAVLPSGVVGDRGQTLTVFVHTETFENGTRPILEVRFDRRRPHEIELRTYAHPDSVAMASCTVSATMGNYALARRLHLRSGVMEAADLWPSDAPMGRMGFLRFQSWPASEMRRMRGGRITASITTDFRERSQVTYHPRVARFWHYEGEFPEQYWAIERGADVEVAVNARDTYWRSQAPIPGGRSFENFELRAPFQAGRRLWFGVRPR